jgi:hypothetical protein
MVVAKLWESHFQLTLKIQQGCLFKRIRVQVNPPPPPPIYWQPTVHFFSFHTSFYFIVFQLSTSSCTEASLLLLPPVGYMPSSSPPIVNRLFVSCTARHPAPAICLLTLGGSARLHPPTSLSPSRQILPLTLAILLLKAQKAQGEKTAGKRMDRLTQPLQAALALFHAAAPRPPMTTCRRLPQSHANQTVLLEHCLRFKLPVLPVLPVLSVPSRLFPLLLLRDLAASAPLIILGGGNSCNKMALPPPPLSPPPRAHAARLQPPPVAFR